jgi:hypothetical protein
VMPGRVYRIHYEDLVTQPEEEVRCLLRYLDLPFEPSCLEFHRTSRAIFTPSAQQVREPINGAGVGRWRAYEDKLLPLKEALGDVLRLYPEIPVFRD